MGIWHSRQTTSLRGNRFYRRPERSHCFGLSLFRQPTLSWTLLPRYTNDERFSATRTVSVGENLEYTHERLLPFLSGWSAIQNLEVSSVTSGSSIAFYRIRLHLRFGSREHYFRI